MPLILKRNIGDNLRLGVWQIREPEEWFLERMRLDPEELEDLMLLKSQAKREQRLAYRMVLIHLLGHNNFIITYDDHRKPHIHGIGGQISVSHSGDMAAAMICNNRPAGIDVEKVSDRIYGLTEKFLALSECMEVVNERSPESLTLIWCAKEALYKLDGKKGLHFKRDLLVSGVSSSGSNSLKGRILLGEHQGIYDLAWERVEDYVMVYTL